MECLVIPGLRVDGRKCRCPAGEPKAVFTFQLCCLLLFRWLQEDVPVFLVPSQSHQGEVWLWLQWSWIFGRHQQKATRLQSDLLDPSKLLNECNKAGILTGPERDLLWSRIGTQDCFIKCEIWYTCSTSSWFAGRTFPEGFGACHCDLLSWGLCSNNKWDCIDTISYSRQEG